MSTNNVLLDVDRSIIEKNLLLKDESGLSFASPNDELQRLFPLPKTPEVPFKVIQLVPGLCVKTRNKAGDKVFLNICTADEIPSPPDVSEMELARILSSDNDSTFRVPMSLGEGRKETDKAGKECHVFDVAINTKALSKMRNNELFKQFLLTAAMEGISDKYKVDLDIEDTVILTKKKSMGIPKSQRIRNSGPAQPAMPLISEICPAQAVELKPRARVPKYKIRGEPLNGPLERMIAEVSLNDVVSSAELCVDVGEDRIVVQGSQSGYKLDVFLPHNVEQDTAFAQFNTDTRVLSLTLPVKMKTAGQ